MDFDPSLEEEENFLRLKNEILKYLRDFMNRNKLYGIDMSHLIHRLAFEHNFKNIEIFYISYCEFFKEFFVKSKERIDQASDYFKIYCEEVDTLKYFVKYLDQLFYYINSKYADKKNQTNLTKILYVLWIESVLNNNTVNSQYNFRFLDNLSKKFYTKDPFYVPALESLITLRNQGSRTAKDFEKKCFEVLKSRFQTNVERKLRFNDFDTFLNIARSIYIELEQNLETSFLPLRYDEIRDFADIKIIHVNTEFIKSNLQEILKKNINTYLLYSREISLYSRSFLKISSDIFNEFSKLQMMKDAAELVKEKNHNKLFIRIRNRLVSYTQISEKLCRVNNDLIIKNFWNEYYKFDRSVDLKVIEFIDQIIQKKNFINCIVLIQRIFRFPIFDFNSFDKFIESMLKRILKGEIDLKKETLMHQMLENLFTEEQTGNLAEIIKEIKCSYIFNGKIAINIKNIPIKDERGFMKYNTLILGRYFRSYSFEKNKENPGLPKDLKEYILLISDIFDKKFKQTKIEWIYKFSFAEILIKNDQQYILKVRFLEAVILTFIGSENISDLKTLSIITKISEEFCENAIEMYIEYKIILGNTSKFSLNHNFTSNSYFIDMTNYHKQIIATKEEFDYLSYYKALIIKLLKVQKINKKIDLLETIKEKHIDVAPLSLTLFYQSLDELKKIDLIEEDDDKIKYMV